MDVQYLRSRWSTVKNGTTYYLEEEMVESLPLVNSPWVVGGIIVCYLAFTKIGPRLMESQKPYDLVYIMRIYNIMQVMYNAWLIQLFFQQNGVTYLWTKSCHPPEVHLNPKRLELVVGTYYYYLAKLADLLDTVFMVLRKKNSHISYLHLFHHSSMVASVWFSLKFIRSEPGVLLGILNCFVHVVMYTYYFLSTLGPKLRRYLWWKRYLTQLQILQFVVALTFIVLLVVRRCDIHPLYQYVWSFNLLSFLILFLNFYIQSYKPKKVKNQ